MKRFYVQGMGVNNGTVRWRPLFSQTEICTLDTINKLFHPVKEVQELLTHCAKNKTRLYTRIVYVSISESLDYSSFLYLSIYSLLRYHRCDICVLTDNNTKFLPFVERHAMIKRIDIPEGNTAIDWKSNYLKTQIGRFVHERFLYLDCDTFVVRPIDEIDSCKCDLACSLEYNSMYSNNLNHTRTAEEGNHATSLWRNAYFNSGVILCNGSKAALEFFESWHSEWRKYFEMTGKCIEQPPLYKANMQRDGFIMELPSKFNWISHMHQHVCPDCRIVNCCWHNITQP